MVLGSEMAEQKHELKQAVSMAAGDSQIDIKFIFMYLINLIRYSFAVAAVCGSCLELK